MDEATINAKRARLKELNATRKAAEEKRMNDFLAQFISRHPAPEVMEKVQYRHDSFFGQTFSVVPPAKEELTMAAAKLFAGAEAVPVHFQIGISRLNAADADQYNRQVGRAVSAANITGVVGELRNLHVDKDKSFFTVQSGNTNFEFMLSHGRITPFLSNVWSTSLEAPYDERVAEHRRNR